MKNKRLRLVAEWMVILIAAIVMWFFVISDQNPMVEKKLDIPLQYKNVGDGLTVVAPHDSVRIVVRAARERINDLRSSDFEATIDLKGMHEGNHNLRASITSPEKVEIMDDGGEQSIRIEQAVEKQVLLELRRITEGNKAYLIKDIVKPDFVIIKGSKENVYSVAKAVAEIELGKITASTTVEIVPKLYNASGDVISDGIQVNPPKITVVVNMYAEKEVPVIADFVDNISNQKVVCTPQRVKIYGNAEDLTWINSISTAKMSFQDLKTGKKTSSKLVLPENVHTVADVTEVECSLAKGI